MVVLKTVQPRANLMLPEPAKTPVQDGLQLFGGTGMGAVQGARHDKMSAEKGPV
jgi:hypothetical protein